MDTLTAIHAAGQPQAYTLPALSEAIALLEAAHAELALRWIIGDAPSARFRAGRHQDRLRADALVTRRHGGRLEGT